MARRVRGASVGVRAREVCARALIALICGDPAETVSHDRSHYQLGSEADFPRCRNASAQDFATGSVHDGGAKRSLRESVWLRGAPSKERRHPGARSQPFAATIMLPTMSQVPYLLSVSKCESSEGVL